ncbi:MAG: hypothetical protein OXF02_05380 [Simkaniaceae bacterium]|nr:hypothetical protein [Simkaniaceae bacterium]
MATSGVCTSGSSEVKKVFDAKERGQNEVLANKADKIREGVGIGGPKQAGRGMSAFGRRFGKLFSPLTTLWTGKEAQPGPREVGSPPRPAGAGRGGTGAGKIGNSHRDETMLAFEETMLAFEEAYDCHMLRLWGARKRGKSETAIDEAMLAFAEKDVDAYLCAHKAMLTLRQKGEEAYFAEVDNIPVTTVVVDGEKTKLGEILDDIYLFFASDRNGFDRYVDKVHLPENDDEKNRSEPVPSAYEMFGGLKGDIDRNLCLLAAEDMDTFERTHDAMCALEREGREAFEARVKEIPVDKKVTAGGEKTRLGRLLDNIPELFLTDRESFGKYLGKASSPRLS